jgi:hypothetical protein
VVQGQAVKINVDTGTVEVISSGYKIPAAVNIDPQSRDDLYVIDTGTGSVWKVSLSSKARRLVATLKPGLDNLAFDSRGRLFVTMMTDNGIYLVDKVTGASKTIVEGKLAIPGDLAVVSEGGKDHGARGRRLQLSHRRRPDRRRRRRDARPWRASQLSAGHLGRPEERAAVELVLDDGRQGRPQDRASWSPRWPTSRRRSMPSSSPTARSMSPSWRAATWSRSAPTARSAAPWSRNCAVRWRWRAAPAT